MEDRVARARNKGTGINRINKRENIMQMEEELKMKEEIEVKEETGKAAKNKEK